MYRYICKCVCVYVFTQVRVISISISISISIPISTYLPSVPQFLYLHQQKKHAPASIDHRFLFPPPRPTRAYACACAYVCVYMNLWKDSPPCPILFELRPVRPPPFPPKKKRRSLRRLRPPPPSPCDGSSHIQSQLDKTRQDKTRQGKASYLPACARIKKKIRNPPSDNVTMLISNLPSMDYYRGGWPV